MHTIIHPKNQNEKQRTKYKKGKTQVYIATVNIKLKNTPAVY